MRRLIAVIGLLLGTATVHAHDVRPAYLEIVERPAGDLAITWKRAATNNSATLTPRFSTGWTDSPPASTRQAGDAVERTWNVAESARAAGGRHAGGRRPRNHDYRCVAARGLRRRQRAHAGAQAFGRHCHASRRGKNWCAGARIPAARLHAYLERHRSPALRLRAGAAGPHTPTADQDHHRLHDGALHFARRRFAGLRPHCRRRRSKRSSRSASSTSRSSCCAHARRSPAWHRARPGWSP